MEDIIAEHGEQLARESNEYLSPEPILEEKQVDIVEPIIKEPNEDSIQKPKKSRSEKQKEAFKACQEARRAKIQQRNEIKVAQKHEAKERKKILRAQASAVPPEPTRNKP